jgi:hypothetical protein
MLTLSEPVIEITAGTVDDSTAAEVYRNLQVLYNTVAGEQALDRDFGIDANVMDYPWESAKALLAAEYVRKTEQYEPRAQVSYVDWTGEKADGNMIPKVVVQIV